MSRGKLTLEEREKRFKNDIDAILYGDDEQSGFDDSGLMSVEFERQNPSGKFAPVDTRPDPSVPADRAPDGRFVSEDRSEIDSFGRRDDGLFDLF